MAKYIIIYRDRSWNIRSHYDNLEVRVRWASSTPKTSDCDDTPRSPRRYASVCKCLHMQLNPSGLLGLIQDDGWCILISIMYDLLARETAETLVSRI